MPLKRSQMMVVNSAGFDQEGSEQRPYKIKRSIASGGSGGVFVAKLKAQSRPHTLAAVKATGASPHALQREFKLLSRAHSACPAFVLQPYCAGPALAGKRTLSALVSELLGQTLESQLSSRAEMYSPLEERLHCRAVLHCSAALDALHSLQPPLIHRDIKALNLMLRSDTSTWVLADFGSAVQQEPFRIDCQKQAAEVENECLRSTTPSLRAPEQWQALDKLLSPAVDIWALGCLLFRILYGREPFMEGTSNSVLNRNTETPLWQRIADNDHLSSLCERMLSLEPKQRPSASSIYRELTQLLDFETDSAHHQKHALQRGGTEDRGADCTDDVNRSHDCDRGKEMHAHTDHKEAAVQASVLPTNAHSVLERANVEMAGLDLYNACSKLADLLQVHKEVAPHGISNGEEQEEKKGANGCSDANRCARLHADQTFRKPSFSADYASWNTVFQ
jgi:serine/threonine protein kinase